MWLGRLLLVLAIALAVIGPAFAAPTPIVVLWLATLSPSGKIFATSQTIPHGVGLLTPLQLCEEARKVWIADGETPRFGPSEPRVRNERYAICLTLTPAGSDA
jgi:hypothetical protein